MQVPFSSPEFFPGYFSIHKYLILRLIVPPQKKRIIIVILMAIIKKTHLAELHAVHSVYKGGGIIITCVHLFPSGNERSLSINIGQ